MSSPAAPARHEARSEAPRLALRVEEAAQALGISDDHFRKHVAGDLAWVRGGRVKVVSIRELERWITANGERILG